MAIQLFRLLFKEEEYAGKSLTGAPAKSGERKPAVDQERLQGIYGMFLFKVLMWNESLQMKNKFLEVI